MALACQVTTPHCAPPTWLPGPPGSAVADVLPIWGSALFNQDAGIRSSTG